MYEGMMERPDGVSIYYKAWDDVENPIACLQIAHGMGEHIERYDGFARYLNKYGIIVYGNDHRGHGKSAKNIENLGSFGRENAWSYLVEDMEALSRLIRRRERNLPLFLLGHSMGSFLARTYITTTKDPLEGAIICGTGSSPKFMGKLGQTLINFEIRKNGWQAISPKINNMIFGANNKPFQPERTPMDWLNRDEKEVDKYIADPYCGGEFDNGFFKDLLKTFSMLTLKTARKNSQGSAYPIYFRWKRSGWNDGKRSYGICGII